MNTFGGMLRYKWPCNAATWFVIAINGLISVLVMNLLISHFSSLCTGYTPLFHPRTHAWGVTPVEISSLCSNKRCPETAINGAEKGCRDQSGKQRKLFWTNYPHSTVSRRLSLSWAMPKYTFPSHTCRQLWTTLADSCVTDSRSTKWRLAKMWCSKQRFCLSITFLHHLF